MAKHLVVLVMGPQGAGKGTAAQVLSEKLGIPIISTGDLFRQHIRDNTELGLQISAVMKAGKLVDDLTTLAVVNDRTQKDDCANGFILDGYPRTAPQAAALNSWLNERYGKGTPDLVLWIEASDAAVVKRISGRRVCSKCGSTFHIEYSKPKEEGICDKCGGALSQRDDDTEAALKARLDLFSLTTQPLMDVYSTMGILTIINGEKPIEEVLKDVGAAVERLVPKQHEPIPA